MSIVMEMDASVGELQPSECLMQAFISRTDTNTSSDLMDLPISILSFILVRISDPVDVASVICSCRLFRALSKSIPFRIRIWSSKLDATVGAGGYEDLRYTRFNLPAVGSWTRKSLGSVRRQMLATKILDLSGCWIVDEDVAAVLADLRCLEFLILDDCQKLTSAVADALAASVRSGPQALSLQRCFGLGPAAAGNLLAAAAADGSRLQCVLFSHLDRLDLPRDLPLLDVHEERTDKNSDGEIGSAAFLGGCIMGSGIRILALHNCDNIGLPELAAVGITCPMLEFLLLGGSVEGLGLCRPESLTQEKVTAAVSTLVKTTESLKHLVVLEITFFTATVTHGVREHIGKDIEVWDFCERMSVSSAVAFLVGCKSGCSNTYKQTHMHTDVLMQDVTDDSGQNRFLRENKRSQGLVRTDNLLGRKCVDVYRSAYEGIVPRAISFFCNIERKGDSVENVFLALRAASNCTDLRRRTPLHVAAAGSVTETVRDLLAIGAKASGMKDSGGATALFVAAECGYADACELLLESGADVLSRNRAGENPLYIAALRGHSAAVEVMLSHCHANRIDWQSASVYGDGWTPLMAAAVADRQDVAKVLLRAAGVNKTLDCPSGECWDFNVAIYRRQRKMNAAIHIHSGFRENASSNPRLIEQTCLNNNKGGTISSEVVSDLYLETQLQSRMAPPHMLDAQNRYGQTAMHIAARRASLWFVLNLLHAGASLDICDGYGRCALDIAQYHNHAIITNVLKQWGEFQSAYKPLLSLSPTDPAPVLPDTTSYNLGSRSKQSNKGNLPHIFQGRTRGKKNGSSDSRAHQNLARANSSRDNAIGTVAVLSSVTIGSSKQVWRTRREQHKVHPDTHSAGSS